MVRVEKRGLGIIRLLQPSFSKCHYQDLGNGSEWASLGLYFHINPGAKEEENAGEEHEDGGDGKTQCPVHVALDVDDEGGGDHHGSCEREVVPIEEAVDAPPSRLRMGVELVSAKG